MFESRGNGNLRRRGKATVLVHASRNRGDPGWSGRIRGVGVLAMDNAYDQAALTVEKRAA